MSQSPPQGGPPNGWPPAPGSPNPYAQQPAPAPNPYAQPPGASPYAPPGNPYAPPAPNPHAQPHGASPYAPPGNPYAPPAPGPFIGQYQPPPPLQTPYGAALPPAPMPPLAAASTGNPFFVNSFRNPRWTGLGGLLLGLICAGANGAMYASTGRFIIRLVFVTPPLILAGLWLLVVGQPLDPQTGRTAAWARTGLAVMGGLGALLGVLAVVNML